MRNPRRIWRVLWKVYRLWRRYPDLRLGQLLINVAPKEALVWSLEEDAWIEYIDSALTRGLGWRKIER